MVLRNLNPFEELRKWDCISPETAIISLKEVSNNSLASLQSLRRHSAAILFAIMSRNRTRVDCSSDLRMQRWARPHLGSFLVEPPCLPGVSSDLPIYGQVIQWGAWWCPHALACPRTRCRFFGRNCRHTGPESQNVVSEHVCLCFWGGSP